MDRNGRYIAIVLVALAVGIGLDAMAAERHRAREQLQMTRMSAAAAAAIEREIAEKILISEGVTAAFLADAELSRSRFVELVGQLTRSAPDVINVAAAPGFVIEYVYPEEPNRAAIGLDLAARPDFWPGVEQAIGTGQTILTGPFELVQGGLGFITRAAVPDPAAPQDGLETWGVISLAIDARRLFEEAGLDRVPPTIAISVHDSRGALLFGPDMTEDAAPMRTAVTGPGVRWSVSAMPVGGWATVSPTSNRMWAIVAAIAVAVLTLTWALSWAFGRKQRAETQLAEAIEALEDAFALFDVDDRLLMFNGKYKEFYAEAAGAISKGARFEDIIRHAAHSGQFVDAIGREEDWIEERLEQHRDPGDPIEQELAGGRWTRVVERRTPSGSIVGFRVDITALKQALQRSEAANAAKTTFLNTVSHELRTPLTVVLGYNAFLGHPETMPGFVALKQAIEEGDRATALIQLEALRAEIVRHADQIDRSGQHLLHLISGILDLASLEDGNFRLNAHVIPLGPLVRDVIEQFCPIARRKGVALSVETDCTEVVADPMRLRQILFNLMDNALKFTEAGRVTVRAVGGPDRTWVEVEDTGCGIAEDNLGFIFDRFRQADHSDSRRHGGVGLGLAIARELAELQGGRLEAKSELGKGSVFRLELRTHRRPD
ncbi:ATP-binding protein [Roseibacterium sp. SDUM158017]|uniref:ATP-binding protein n=1 Tax=Roseicyclus salinarum TaxID=3036773 RepID=UPI002414E252|nr:ATP-binding protein [Roseibacterium sp. SDUM158017]MDG4649230.1 ATP-binding protein [Roseibacterium sp. SDUM158017]